MMVVPQNHLTIPSFFVIEKIKLNNKKERKKRLTQTDTICIYIEEKELIGFGRLITDRLTFAYLTDVYVLPSHQGKGLARFMMSCLDEIVSEWDEHLRRLLLFTRDEEAAKLYKHTLGAQDVRETGTGKLICMERVGGGNTFQAPDH